MAGARRRLTDAGAMLAPRTRQLSGQSSLTRGGVFVRDSFAEVFAQLANHIGEVGAVWTRHPSYPLSNIVISDAERARNTVAGAVAFFASGVPPTPDYSVQATLRNVGPGFFDAGIAGRVSAVNDTMYLAWWNTAAVRWELYRGNAGVFGLLANFPQAWGVGVDRVLALRMIGARIIVAVDGVAVIDVVDGAPLLAAGRVALRFNNFGGGPPSDVLGIHTDALIAESI